MATPHLGDVVELLTRDGDAHLGFWLGEQQNGEAYCVIEGPEERLFRIPQAQVVNIEIMAEKTDGQDTQTARLG